MGDRLELRNLKEEFDKLRADMRESSPWMETIKQLRAEGGELRSANVKMEYELKELTLEANQLRAANKTFEDEYLASVNGAVAATYERAAVIADGCNEPIVAAAIRAERAPR